MQRCLLSLLVLFVGTAHAGDPLQIVLSAQPAASDSNPYAVFEFEANAAITYQCALDSAAFAACSSPHVLLPVSPGTHRLEIQAFDAAAQAGPVAAVDWTVTSVFASAHADLIATQVQPAPVAPNSWRGILRINCDFSHAAYDDPLVFHGQPGRAHYHNFYGLFATDADTTRESTYAAEVDAQGRVTSCQGNRLNRSSYWVPALLAPLYDQAGVRQLDDDGAPAWQVVDAVVGNDDEAHEVFYYSVAIDDLDAVQVPPPGLSIIAGSAATPPGQPQPSSVARWHCQSWEASDAGNPDFRGFIPECVAPDRVRFDVFFPSCWNGVDLDSADHKAHMAYAETVGGLTRCPSSHPIALPRVSYHYAFGVRPTNYDPTSLSSRGWRLAADMYHVDETTPGGYSLHADWINGWHPEVMQAVIDHCLKQALDCHDGNIGNGFRLAGTAAGVQMALPIVNEGLGINDSRDRVFSSGFEASDTAMHGH